MVVVIIVFTFVVRTSAVEGTSMLPTLEHEDELLVVSFFYTPRHDDIIVAHAPNLYDHKRQRQGKDVIKRVIGLEGDVILIEKETGLVYRNGAALDAIEEGVLTDSNRQSDLEVTVPAGFVFVLGDNRHRHGSADSRCDSIGLIDVNYIVGRAFFRLSPFSDKKFGFVS
jgi:signal peptidase I